LRIVSYRIVGLRISTAWLIDWSCARVDSKCWWAVGSLIRTTDPQPGCCNRLWRQRWRQRITT